ncbi:MAG: preprotein translocase subunit SecG [Christensenellales bacterium]
MLSNLLLETVPLIPYEVQSVLKPIFLIVMVLLAIAMVVLILLQNSNPENLGAITGSTESYYGQNKARSKESRLKKATIWIAVALVVVSVLYFLMQIIKYTI